MNPLRMCAVCRERKEKKELIRVAKIKGEEMKIDLSFKAQGRGAYICKNISCIENGRKRKVFERIFSQGECSEIYNNLGEIINE